MLLRLETEVHDSVEIDDDLPGDLIIGAIARDDDTLNFEDTFEDYHSYIDKIVWAEEIANFITWREKSPKSSQDIQSILTEVYAKDPSPLRTKGIIHTQVKDRI